MSHFNVVLHGQGIRCPFEGSADSVIGFYTTRRVKARDLQEAEALAREAVLVEWCDGGQYAAVNLGAVPELAIEDAYEVGLWTGLFGRRPGGYAFYSNDDVDAPDAPDASPSHPASSEWALGELEAAIHAHGLEVVRQGDELSVDGGRLLLQARVFDRDPAGGQATVVLEVCAYSPALGDAPIIECFAGWGSSRERAIAAAFGKLLMGSLHVLMEGLTRHACDQGQAEIEHWVGTGHAWRVWSGPLLNQQSSQSALTPAYPQFMAQLTALFESRVPPGPHWVRVFLGTSDGVVQGSEVLLDNEPWQEGHELLLAQPWAAVQEYQSVRHFFLALPEAGSTAAGC
jgi:hypothetical protein